MLRFGTDAFECCVRAANARRPLRAALLAAVVALLVGFPAQSALAQGNVPGSLSQLAPPNDCYQQAIDGTAECGGGGGSGQGLNGAQDTVVSPDGKNVYVVAPFDNSIAQFARSSDGALVPLDSPCVASSRGGSNCPSQSVNGGMENPRAIAISPDGKNVYVTAQDATNGSGFGTIIEFARNSSDGSLTQLAPNGCIEENVPPPGSNAQPTPECPNASGHGIQNPVAIAVSPDGANLYVADQGGAVSEFARNANGALTQLNGADACIYDRNNSNGSESADCPTQGYGVGTNQTTGVVISPDGKSVYTAGWSSVDNAESEPGVIAEFTRTADGSLSQPGGANDCIEQQSSDEGCATTGLGFVGQTGLAISPDGGNLYSASQEIGGPIAEFTRNGDGSLTQLAAPNNCIQEGGNQATDFGCGTTGTGIAAGYRLVVSPDGANVYAAAPNACSVGCNAVAEFTRNSDGSLAQLQSPTDCIQERSQQTPDCGDASGTGLGGPGIAISPDAANVYVTGVANGGDIAEFARTPVPHTLSVSLTGSGSGTVTDGTGAISCRPTCSHAYTAGSQVVLTATPSSGSTFAGWSGGGCSGTGGCQVTMSSDQSVQATFSTAARPGPQPPAVLQGPPSVKSSTGAGFSGIANPEGSPTTVFFEYGLDPQYGAPGGGIIYSHRTTSQQIGSDASDHSVSDAVSGLVPNAIYHVRMVATNSGGTAFGADDTFKTIKDPPPPPPVLGQSADLKPVSGIVLIKPPAGQSLGHAADARTAAALSIGQGFIPLTEARRIPTGSQVDARRGTLGVTTASGGGKGKTQQVTLRGGVFRFVQTRSGANKGLTTMSLLEGAFKGGPTFASCPKAAADNPVAQAALSRKILQTLHASDRRGRFTTRGRYSAATVRGTNWNTIDRCTGTSTVVNVGVVSVQDFVRHRTVVVHGGHHYLAQRP